MRSLHFVGRFPHLFPLTRTANLVETDVTVRAAPSEGVRACNAARVIFDALTEHGPLTREEPRDRLEPHDLRTEGQALVDGVAGATWGLTARALTVRPYRPLTRAEITALRRGTADVLRDL